jgi:hypothetical protein
MTYMLHPPMKVPNAKIYADRQLANKPVGLEKQPA